MSRFEELTRKVDGFFARVVVRHGTDMQCSTGCSDCCHVRLTITGIEAAAIRAHVTTWPAEQRRHLAVQDAAPAGPPGSSERCAALDPAGRCKIYDARPLVCRSHGVPVRIRHGALPVVQACHRNFTQTTPDPDCVLDQATLSAMLLAVDAEAIRLAPRRAAGAAACSTPAGTEGDRDVIPGRVDLAGLLAELAAV